MAKIVTEPDWVLRGQTVTVKTPDGGLFRGLVKGMGTRCLMVSVDWIDIGNGLRPVKPELRQFPFPVELAGGNST